MDQNNQNLTIEERIRRIPIRYDMEDSFYKYAMAVNVSRAIPDVRDGLKPVHRRIIYSMGELGIFSDKGYKKCARIVGDCMGKYHPHGDSSIYDALVRMAQDFSINTPLIDGHGNFGSIDGDPPAAMRYTEARLSKIAGEMLRDIDKNTVDFYPNFDGTEMQPTVLPGRFPNLLVNGSDGIAVGMATNIPPHNLREVCNAVIATIDNPDIDIEELISLIPAPDFPTKGLILGRSGVKKAYRTGRGSFIIRGRAEIEEFGGNRHRIVITEIPYQVIKEKLIGQIADHVKTKRLEGVSNIVEESDREGMRLVIELKKDANPQVVLNYLYKHTQLQISFGAIMLALVNGTPKVCNLKEIITAYIAFQKEVITRRTQFDLDKAQQRLHILEGLAVAIASIDDVIATIKESADRQDAITKLTTRFTLDEVQAQAILEMQLRRLTGLEIEKIKEELANVKALVAELESILADEGKVYAIIKDDLTTTAAKYGVDRKSEISIDYGDIDIADLIEKETVVISLTHGGYIKRISASEYKAQHRGGVGIVAHKTKEEDFVEAMFVTNSHDDLLCFSTKGKVYTIKAYEVPEAQRQSKGRAMVNLLTLEQDERISTIIPMNDYEHGNLMMATKNGLIKKTSIDQFARINKNGKIAIKLTDGDELVAVYYTTGEDEVIIASSEGKCIRFSEKTVRPLGRDTQGVKSMDMNKGEVIVDMAVIRPDHYMLTISEYGYGKLSNQDEYKVQGRGGKGIKAGIFNEVTGNLVNLKQITLDDDLMIIADDGTTIRMNAKEISLIGRNTKGVRVMKMKEGAKIVGVAVTPNEDELDVPECEETTTATLENFEDTAESKQEIEKELSFDVSEDTSDNNE